MHGDLLTQPGSPCALQDPLLHTPAQCKVTGHPGLTLCLLFNEAGGEGNYLGQQQLCFLGVG